MSITFIHLTDIHLSENKNDNWILTRIDKIINACESVINRNDEVIFVLSGDVAYSGKQNEYKNASLLLDSLKNKIDDFIDNPSKFIIVPGNHDCDFPNTNNDKRRDRLLQTLQIDEQVDKETINDIRNVQKNFDDFAEKYDNCAEILTKKIFEFKTEKILFLKFNSAWMSTIHEKAGSLFIPDNYLESINPSKYDCVIAVMHHPYGWFHPDNANKFINYLRKNIDILILGHEHISDRYSVQAENYSYEVFKGRELQGKDPKIDCAFTIYNLNINMKNKNTYDFVWNEDRKKFDLNKKESVFRRNTSITRHLMIPSVEFMKSNDDLGMYVQHPQKEEIKLSDIFCWPILEVIDSNNTLSTENYRFSEGILNIFLESQINFVFGTSSSGKTAFSKMLFKEYVNEGKCCLKCDGEELTTYNADNLWKIMQSLFEKEYSRELLDEFIKLKPKDRILIIDNFHKVRYKNSRRGEMLDNLADKFSTIITFFDNEMDMQIASSQVKNCITSGYRMLCLGNKKRRELVEKWYSIGNDYNNEHLNDKVNIACKKIDEILSASGVGIVPAVPIFIISILQNLEFTPSSFQGSQYGFLYETLIKKNLSSIENRYIVGGNYDIDINILSILAFTMLKKNTNIFAEEELKDIIQNFKIEKKISINEESLLSSMTKARIIGKIGTNTYNFRYPYIFYYFSGRYIAYNLEKYEVKSQIEFMSSRLYNEMYGNILIFVCHFANNIKVIEDILLVAYTTLENYEEFEFDKHKEIFEKANRLIDELLVPKSVGEETDVQKNINKELEIKDVIGIQDGTVKEINNKFDEEELEDQFEKDIQSTLAGLRTIDVLGQILKNYPGYIDGDMKVDIIDEIHKLGMRILEAWLSAITSLEEDFIPLVVHKFEIKLKSDSEKKHINTEKIVSRLRALMTSFIASMVRGMINNIANSLNNKSLMPAIKESFDKDDDKLNAEVTLSKKLIMQDLKFNIIKTPNENEIITLAETLKKKKNTFAYTILRSIVAYYLQHNNCGFDMRDRLCKKFELHSKNTLLELQSSNINKKHR